MAAKTYFKLKKLEAIYEAGTNIEVYGHRVNPNQIRNVFMGVLRGIRLVSEVGLRLCLDFDFRSAKSKPDQYPLWKDMDKTKSSVEISIDDIDDVWFEKIPGNYQMVINNFSNAILDKMVKKYAEYLRFETNHYRGDMYGI